MGKGSRRDEVKMWAYHTPEQIQRRLSLGRGEGFWLDYWLFLHMEDALPPWKTRPLGVVGLARLCSHSVTQTYLKELEGVALLADSVGYPRPADFPPAKPPLPAHWLDWLGQFTEAHIHRDFVHMILAKLETGIQAGNFGQIAYLSRRLAAELGDLARSHRDVFLTTMGTVFKTGANRPTPVVDFYVAHTNSSKYEVEFTLSEAIVPTRVKRSTLVSNCRLKTTKKTELDDDQARTNIVNGLIVDVEAVHFAEAFAKALTLCRAVLELLRTRHYVRIDLLGAVRVRAADRDEEVWFGLNQPFWTSQGARGRSVPTFPRRFGFLTSKMEKSEGERWLATRWHVSQALRAWAEDIHSAASSVWQGLESLCPPSGRLSNFERVVGSVLEKYAALSVSDLISYISEQVNRQIGSFRPDFTYDWKKCRDPARATAWARDAVASGLSAPQVGWREPWVPDILVDRNAGILASLTKGGTPVTPDWLRQRLERDLRHLYAIRNAIVHGGQRIGSERWVSYLAASGLEVIFAVGHDAVAKYKSAI